MEVIRPLKAGQLLNLDFMGYTYRLPVANVIVRPILMFLDV